jgi:hypothetical protein
VRKTAKRRRDLNFASPLSIGSYAILLFNSDAVKLLIESNGKDR